MRPLLFCKPSLYKAGKLYSQIGNDFTVSRASTATRVNASGLIESVANDVPRLDYSGGVSCPALLVEGERTNSIRNNTMVGSVAGTPGTLPTNWTIINGGLTRQVIGTGTENEVEYIDIKMSGTASSSSATISYESSLQIVAAQNQVWTNSAYIKIINAQSPPISYSLGFREGSAAGSFVAFGSTSISPTTNLTRFNASRTLTGATTERVQPQVNIALTNGASYDFTIRIGLPQMELGATATSVIKTSGSAVTRLADTITATDMAGATVNTVVFEDGSTVEIVPSGTFTLPVGRINYAKQD